MGRWPLGHVPCRCTLCLWDSAEHDRYGSPPRVPGEHRVQAWTQWSHWEYEQEQAVGSVSAGRRVACAGAHFELVSGWDTQCLGHHPAPTASSWRGHLLEQPEGWLASIKKGRKALKSGYLMAPLFLCWWEATLAQTLWRLTWQCVLNEQMHIPLTQCPTSENLSSK